MASNPQPHCQPFIVELQTGRALLFVRVECKSHLLVCFSEQVDDGLQLGLLVYTNTNVICKLQLNCRVSGDFYPGVQSMEVEEFPIRSADYVYSCNEMPKVWVMMQP